MKKIMSLIILLISVCIWLCSWHEKDHVIAAIVLDAGYESHSNICAIDGTYNFAYDTDAGLTTCPLGILNPNSIWTVIDNGDDTATISVNGYMASCRTNKINGCEMTLNCLLEDSVNDGFSAMYQGNLEFTYTGFDGLLFAHVAQPATRMPHECQYNTTVTGTKTYYF